MKTFARVVDGVALDCQVAADSAELATRFHPEWLAKNPFTLVPDWTLHGATSDGHGGWINPVQLDTSPKPNTPNNPYFGKTPLMVKDFYALVGQVLPGQRYKRLTTDANFLWVKDLIDNLDWVDPDDQKGQFLKIVGVPANGGYLTNTNGEDGQPLMTTQERAAIMGGWK